MWSFFFISLYKLSSKYKVKRIYLDFKKFIWVYYSQYRSADDFIFDLVEGILLFLYLFKNLIVSNKFYKGYCYLSESFDKSLIEIGKLKESSDFFNICRLQSIFYYFNFFIVYFNGSWSDLEF